MNKDIQIGTFQNFNHPIDAEHFTVSEFSRTVKTTVFSEALNKDVEKTEKIFYCPKCNKQQDYPQDHGDAYKCGKCGLNRQSFGDGLYVWNDSKTKTNIGDEINSTVIGLLKDLIKYIDKSKEVSDVRVLKQLRRITKAIK